MCCRVRLLIKHTQTQTYPDLSIISNAENFRLTEISKIKKQIEHYRVVRKKYNKVHKAINNTVSVLGVATTAIPSGAVAASITGVGISVGASLGEIGALCGAVSTGLTVMTKKLEKKRNKHKNKCSGTRETGVDKFNRV